MMQYTPISPFMRPISHAHLRVVKPSAPPAPSKAVNKWALLRELSKAQAAFGVSERELTVLQGLLSFFPSDALDGNHDMVVFPSNKAICERLNGMPCSTMRRHLAQLVQSGLIARRDSPNGKRYARKSGEERVTFGFDLSPLHALAEEVMQAAEAVRETEDRMRRLREVVSLMRRDIAALAEFGDEIHPGLALWDQLRNTAMSGARALRRKLSVEDLLDYHAEFEWLLNQARIVIDSDEAHILVTNDAQSEQHYHNSNKDSLESEPAKKQSGCGYRVSDADVSKTQSIEDDRNTKSPPKIPLRLVTTACPSLATHYQGEIRHWHQLFDAASFVRPSMGISPSAWKEAQRLMGPEEASIVVAAMLERFEDIRSPGGYLRALSSKAAAGEFSCGPMIMALIGRENVA